MKTNKEEILTASLKLFMEKGYEATTTAEIAKAVGLCHSGLFNHFKTKEELFKKAIETFFLNKQDPDLKFKKSEGTFLNFIDIFIDGVAQTMASLLGSVDPSLDSMDYFRLLFDTVKKYPEYGKSYVGFNKTLLSLWKENLDRGLKSGEIKSDIDTTLIAEMFHYTYYGDAVTSAVEERLDPQALKKRYYGFYELIRNK